ncbi:helix-turn-helix domain-containing protein [Streptomyces fagopyri]
MAANLRRLREARGQSLRALSAETHKVGRPLSADAINKIENGRSPEDGGPESPAPIRRVDADDLVALAIVLNVSPNALLLPPKWTEEKIQITPNTELTAKTAWLWAEGRAPASDYGTSPAEIVVTSDDEAEEEARDTAYWAQREQYEALTHPPERRRAARHSANRAAKSAATAVDHLVSSVLGGDKETAARQLKAAKLKLRQLETEVAQLELKLDSGA